jgi:hypothetical protein
MEKLVREVPHKISRKRDDAMLLNTASSVGKVTQKYRRFEM